MTSATTTSRDVTPPPLETLKAVSADGTTLHVETFGTPGAPAVVLIHGYECEIPMFARVIHELAADHFLISYDQRGHGKSDAPKSKGYSYRGLADDLAAVLDVALPKGTKAVLMGHSMGGQAIVSYAAYRNEHYAQTTAAAQLSSTGIDQLLLRHRVVPLAPKAFKWAIQPISKFFLGNPLGTGRNDFISRALFRHVALSRSATREEVENQLLMVQKSSAATRRGFARTLGAMELSKEIASLTVPTQVVVGTKDNLTPPWHADRMHSLLPNSLGVQRLPGEGHMSAWTAAPSLASSIRELATRYVGRTA